MAYSTKAAQAFASILENEKDWEKRVVAMSKMEDTLKTDFGLDLSAKDILIFRPALCAQISDNRTAVSKQACELTTTLAETQSIGFAAHTQVVVSVLLKQTTVTVKVASDAAHVALCLMLRIQALPAAKILLEITKGLKDAHNSTLRRRCSLYLLILIKFRFAGLKAVIEELPAILVTLLRDNSATTRARARAVYMHLTVSSPNHAKLVLQEVDAKVKAILTEEMSLETADMDGFEPTPPASTAGSRIGSRSASRSTSRSASRSTSPERAGGSSSSAARAFAALNSPSAASTSTTGGGLDLSSLERKLASLSARSPLSGLSSSPSPSSPSSSAIPTSPAGSNIPRSPSSNLVAANSKSFVRTASPSATPTKSTPASTAIPKTASASTLLKKDKRVATAASPAAGASTSKLATTPASGSKAASTATSASKTSKIPTPAAKTSQIPKPKVSSPAAASPATKSNASVQPENVEDEIDFDAQSVSSAQLDEQQSEFARAIESAQNEGGVKFVGDWRVALKDLRALVRKTRVFLELEAPELQDTFDAVSKSSSSSSISASTNTTVSAAANSSTVAINSMPESTQDTLSVEETDAANSTSLAATSDPASADAVTDSDAAKVGEEINTAEGGISELTQAELSIVATEQQGDVQSSDEISDVVVVADPADSENIEEGWNEVTGEAEEDYEMPAEDEESVVV